MNTKRIIKSILVLFVAMFLLLSGYLVHIISVYGTRWFTNPHNARLQNIRNTTISGDIKDRNGTVLVTSDKNGNRVYQSDRDKRLATALVVGDDRGQVQGAEALFAQYILGLDQTAVDKISEAINGNKRRGSDITLTIDASLCAYAYDLLDGESGAIILMNYKTGEILASTSYPAYDPNKIDAYLSGEEKPVDSSMVNRVTQGRYAPGSVFKIVTTVAALRYMDNAQNMTFNCTGGLIFDYDTGDYLGDSNNADTSGKHSVLHDYQSGKHGKITLEEAFSKSCNETFAGIAMRVGPDAMRKTAVDMGLNESYMFKDISASSGNYDIPTRDVDLAWSGVGQYKDIMTPINMCLITAGIANGGDIMEPKLLRTATTLQGNVTYAVTPSVYKNILTAREANILKQYMRATVKNGTGTGAAVSGYDVCGKTGTAEVTVNGENLSHAWFTGFIDSDEHPLAICVVVEFGGSGGKVAAPIAHDVFKKAIKLGY